MFELPLFPLHTVLFPGMPLPLHVFEERYREMVQYCLEDKRPFGVVLIRSGVAEGGPLADPYEVGCVAEIVEVQRLEDGRMLLMTVGTERFRILSLNHDRSYLMGTMEEFPFAKEAADQLAQEAAVLQPLVEEYLEILARTGNVEFDPEQMPTDPEDLIFLSAAALQVEMDQKQAFLENDRASVVLHELTRAYRRELLYMRLMPEEDQGIFSLN
ncbi:MAG: LON peptidase substrate-binding domain-containing protein [Ardenticatenaceae bacterium]|nr:LON peptidase substrate-binding domain-containing protein [Anaerolineales bacterium]MCB8984633.1 LON peptidase substrate-binding domain-containing protein [Ardenticatenaceae bacterium]